MTEPAPTEAAGAPMLPGLGDLGGARTSSASPELERWAARLVAELDGAGKLDTAGRLNAMLVVDLARAAGLSARAGKAAGAALAAARLMDAIDRLPALDDNTPAAELDEWAQVVAALAPPEIIGAAD